MKELFNKRSLAEVFVQGQNKLTFMKELFNKRPLGGTLVTSTFLNDLSNRRPFGWQGLAPPF
jgi:hypothetical protein